MIVTLRPMVGRAATSSGRATPPPAARSARRRSAAASSTATDAPYAQNIGFRLLRRSHSRRRRRVLAAARVGTEPWTSGRGMEPVGPSTYSTPPEGIARSPCRPCRPCRLPGPSASPAVDDDDRGVRNRAAMEAAFYSAERVTLAGSMMPSAIRSTYSPLAPCGHPRWRSRGPLQAGWSGAGWSGALPCQGRAGLFGVTGPGRRRAR